MRLWRWFRREPELSRVQIVAALFRLSVIRPEKPVRAGHLNLRLFRTVRPFLTVRREDRARRRAS